MLLLHVLAACCHYASSVLCKLVGLCTEVHTDRVLHVESTCNRTYEYIRTLRQKEEGLTIYEYSTMPTATTAVAAAAATAVSRNS